MLEVRVLGPLEVLVNGAALSLGTRKQQAVLAMLAIHSGRVVTLEELIDELWPEDPPASAVANARTYAANLRRLFDSAKPTGDLIVRRGAGYLLQVDPAAVDLRAFEADCGRARDAHAGGDRAEAVALFATAGARWRGPMLAGVPRGPVLTARCSAVEEERLALNEERAELHLSLAQPAEAARLLRDHVQVHPLRERAHALFMRALSDMGDVAGALNAYTTARTALVDQLGIEPGPELRRLHQVVLNRDSSSRPAPPSLDKPSRSAAPLCWLPRTVADFTGRADLVARMLDAAKRSDDGPVIQLIDGMAGSGKTTLAVHMAYHLVEQYPDAQLFIDMQGHSENSPLEPATALVTLLRQLDVPGGRIPADLDGRVALWHTELGARRAIVVLDNAAGTDQVSPLLPVSPGCVVLVTSRRRLMALDGAHPESLPVLSTDEAMELLAKVVGTDRVKAEPESAEQVARRCGHLPLALRLAGARLSHRPGWRLADLAGRLQHESSVLSELAAENRTVARAFALSYAPLSEPTKHMFRLLGLWPGDHFGSVAAAALSGMALSDAESVVSELVDRHLVDEPEAGRFRLHDLTHEYAHGLALATDSPAERHRAIGHVLDCYLHSAVLASEPLEPAVMRTRVSFDRPLRPDLLIDPDVTNVGWLEAERSNVRALVRHAGSMGHFGYAWRLARVTWRFHYIRGYYDDIIDTHGHGLEAAVRSNDAVGIAAMHNYLASGFVRTGHYQEALNHLNVAIRLRERMGDRQGVGLSRANIGVVYLWQGRLEESARTIERALNEELRSKEDFSRALPNLGRALMLLGRYESALRIHRIHLLTASEQNDRFQVAQALGHIGAVRTRLGDFNQATRLILASLALKRRTGHVLGEGESLNDLAVICRRIGRLQEAERHHRAALVALSTSGERDIESATLNELGLTLAASGKRLSAVEVHQDALAMATKISHPYEQGRALAGIAACIEADDPAEARRHWGRAFAIFRKMGVPERLEVERRLAEFDR